ncbi:VC2046/SO_2500 family protein [Shewanella maritima]|uniref:VC2046/SO_2500 family protein n=1 Tax=Shewanella maritima TaxID=2520507 RepID=UPI0037350424
MQIPFPTINELNLGDRLNTDIHQDQRGDFGLILAMLSDDVREMAQFNLDKHITADEKLQKELQLPPKQALLHNLSDKPDCIDQSKAFRQQGQQQFNLANALVPEAFVTRGQYDADMQTVLTNTSLHCRARFNNDQSSNEHSRQKQLAALMEEHCFVEELEKQRTFSKHLAAA